MSFLNTVLGRGGSSDSNSQSGSPLSPSSPSAQKSPKLQGSNVWQSVFNPGRNYSAVAQRKSLDKYDHVQGEVEAKTMWEQVLKSQNLSRMSAAFTDMDKDGDGYLGAEDLKTHFGVGADVHRMIDAADKNKDGRISKEEFKQMMRES